jgi:hypothetical protein
MTWKFILAAVLLSALVGFEPAEGYAQAPVCQLPDDEVEVHTTAAGIEFVRTPDACFDLLDGYHYEPNYVEVDGLLYHYVDEGPPDGEVILMLHGQPT